MTPNGGLLSSCQVLRLKVGRPPGLVVMAFGFSGAPDVNKCVNILLCGIICGGFGIVPLSSSLEPAFQGRVSEAS